MVQDLVELSVSELDVLGYSCLGHPQNSLVLEHDHERNADRSQVPGAVSEMIHILKLLESVLVPLMFVVEVILSEEKYLYMYVFENEHSELFGELVCWEFFVFVVRQLHD